MKSEAEGDNGNQRGGGGGWLLRVLGGEGEGWRDGGGYTQNGGGRVEKRGKRGTEKTRLPQHDLQIAPSPWRLLSALLFDPKWRPLQGGGWGGR